MITAKRIKIIFCERCGKRASYYVDFPNKKDIPYCQSCLSTVELHEEVKIIEGEIK